MDRVLIYGERALGYSQLVNMLGPILKTEELIMTYLAIIFVESDGYNSARHQNKNGTFDFGLAQLNSSFNKVAEFGRWDKNLLRGARIFMDRLEAARVARVPNGLKMLLAIEGYNKGFHGALKRLGNFPYAQKVLKVRNQFEIRDGFGSFPDFSLGMLGFRP